MLSFLKSIHAQDDYCLDCIVVYGDSRTNHEIHREIVNSILRIKPYLVFHAGDIVEDKSKQQDWDNFNTITEQLRKDTEFYPVLGNLEKDSDQFFKNFPFLRNNYYSIKKFGIYFIMLDSNLDLKTNSLQYYWLESELKKITETHRPIIVVLHHPVFSVGGYYFEDLGLKNYLVPLFEKYKVAIVFSGHEHNYQRFFHNSIYYIITGGGGAPLTGKFVKNKYNQKFMKIYHFCVLSIINDQLLVKVYGINLNLIDEFIVKLR